LYLSEDQFQECGLSGSVRPDQGQPGVEIESELQVPVDPWRLVVVPETDVLLMDNEKKLILF